MLQVSVARAFWKVCVFCCNDDTGLGCAFRRHLWNHGKCSLRNCPYWFVWYPKADHWSQVCCDELDCLHASVELTVYFRHAKVSHQGRNPPWWTGLPHRTYSHGHRGLCPPSTSVHAHLLSVSILVIFAHPVCQKCDFSSDYTWAQSRSLFGEIPIFVHLTWSIFWRTGSFLLLLCIILREYFDMVKNLSCAHTGLSCIVNKCTWGVFWPPVFFGLKGFLGCIPDYLLLHNEKRWHSHKMGCCAIFCIQSLSVSKVYQLLLSVQSFERLITMLLKGVCFGLPDWNSQMFDWMGMMAWNWIFPQTACSKIHSWRFWLSIWES